MAGCENIFAATAVISLLSACSHSHTVTAENGDAKVTVEQGKGDNDSALHVQGRDGSSVDINTGKAITDYPSDVPLYRQIRHGHETGEKMGAW